MIATPTSTINGDKIKPAPGAERWVYTVTALQRLLDRYQRYHRPASERPQQPPCSCTTRIAISQTIEVRPSQSAPASQKH